jgi:hypothetical protein
MMVDPAPVLPLLPTAMQSFELAHEILVTSTEFGGGDWLVQVEPLLRVPTANGTEVKFVPAATQLVAFTHTTAASCEPIGMEDVSDHVVKFCVFTVMAPPPEAIPVATQKSPEKQDTAERTLTNG